jgi:glycerol-3-phosphate O-acyltransferase
MIPAEILAQFPLPEEVEKQIAPLSKNYVSLYAKHRGSFEEGLELYSTFRRLIAEALQSPPNFGSYHEAELSPFNYHTFGKDFIRPLIDYQKSEVRGANNLKTIASCIEANENVILFSNHQIEPDPQIISIMLEKEFPRLSREMIFVAGHRVTQDPVAIPFSRGCNILSIFSKKYIDTPPEQKSEKLLHNRRTIATIEKLLSAGGKCIYVAPSGGRDRKDARGKLHVAPFDSDSIAIFHLLGKKAKRPTHFFTLALATYPILPPPQGSHRSLGELRSMSFHPVFLHFSEAIQMDRFSAANKEMIREARGEYITSLVEKNYRCFPIDF